MIASLAVASAVALAAAPDPCAPVEPAPVRDAVAAAAYRAVGEAERAAGAADSATAAYRAAAASDPSDGRARTALAELCAELAEASFDEGVRLMDAGDRRGAIAAFGRAREGGADRRAAALLEGVCLYEEGDDEAATARLREAEADPAHRDAARLFLGLVALRAGRAADAEDLLARSAADPALAPFARDLVRAARQSGRLVLSFAAESGWDSNVDLAPGLPDAEPSQDGVAALTTAADLRPSGEAGPFLRAVASWREQARQSAFDMGGVGATAGWHGGHGARSWHVEYGYDRRWLAGDAYLSAHRLLGAARMALGRALAAGATWVTRFEGFERAQDAGYSGTRHLAELDLGWAGERIALTAAWRAGQDLADDPALAWRETGPRVAARFQATPRTRIALDGGLAWRRYDAADANGKHRHDVGLDLAAAVDRELGDRWTLRASASVQRQASSDRLFTYTRVVPMVGIGYTVGVL